MSVGNAALMQINLSWEIVFLIFVCEFIIFLKVSWAIIDNTLLGFFFLCPPTTPEECYIGSTAAAFQHSMHTARPRLPHVPHLTQGPFYTKKKQTSPGLLSCFLWLIAAGLNSELLSRYLRWKLRIPPNLEPNKTPAGISRLGLRPVLPSLCRLSYKTAACPQTRSFYAANGNEGHRALRTFLPDLPWRPKTWLLLEFKSSFSFLFLNLLQHFSLWILFCTCQS